VTLLAQDITENVLSVNNVAESVTFRQVNKNNIHVHDTDSIPTVYRQYTDSVLRYLIYLPMQHSVQ